MYKKWTAAFLLLLVSATTAFVVTRPTNEARTAALHARAVNAWADPEQRAGTTGSLRAMNPEWDLMRRTFLVLAVVDEALPDPNEHAAALRLIDDVIADTVAQEDAHGQDWFLLPYVYATPFRDPSGRSLFVDGEIALMLGARRVLADDPNVARAHQERVAGIEEVFARSPAMLPESYPDEAWLFCVTNALVAVRIAEVLDGADHRDLIEGWTKLARTQLVHETGLLGSEFSWSGVPQDGPEGSSLWLVVTNLLVLDPAFAAEQYAGADEALIRRFAGFAWASEWGPGWRGPVDVDSGPIVPIVDASPSSSGFAIVAARAIGDDATFAALTRSLGAADLVVRMDPRLAELAANPMGDVIVLHGLTFGPLWDRLKPAVPPTPPSTSHRAGAT